MNLLFLDLDGVVNRHVQHSRTRYCSTEKECVAALDRVLVETEAQIVVTSAWRYLVHNRSMRLSGFKNLLHTHWIDGERVIGITRRDITDGIIGVKSRTDRGPQITEYLQKIGWGDGSGRYVVLDDGGHDPETGAWTDLEIEASGHPVVWTQEDVGMTGADADRVIAILRGCEI